MGEFEYWFGVLEKMKLGRVGFWHMGFKQLK